MFLALSKLTLVTKGMVVQILPNGKMRGRLLSEVAFHFALVKMPALKTLQLFGRFKESFSKNKHIFYNNWRFLENSLDYFFKYDLQPTQEMIDLWKNAREASGRGGALVYSLDGSDDNQIVWMNCAIISHCVCRNESCGIS